MASSKEERPFILLVEDDKLTRTVLRHDLKLHGFEVDIAENGDVALKKLQRATKHGKVGYDLVLTDVFMPKVDGEALVRSVTADFRNQLPVAVMSANCEEGDKNRLLRSGASEYLVKPIKSESLAQLRRLVPSKVARDTQESKLTPNEDAHMNRTGCPELAVLCTRLFEAQEASNQSMAVDSSIADAHNARTESGAAKAAPAEHSTGSDETGMDAPETQGHVRTPSPRMHQADAAHTSAADATNTSSPCDTSHIPSILAPLHGTGVSSSPMLNVAVVMPPGMSPMATEQANTSQAAAAAQDTDMAEQGSQHFSSTAAASTFCAQIVPANVTFISSAGNMAPIATRKAALVRFREKKARSHFAPKVRYYERKKLAEARPRYKGQFVKLEQLPKEQQQAIAQAKAAAAAASSPENAQVKA